MYVSNESNANVFFDNLQVFHTRGPVLEETHYYPFGLTMSGISSKALDFGGIENKYKFNDGTELANKEFSDGSGLELYETPFRGYDPQIGRFWQIDAMADDYASWSPYTFALDNPIFFNDPSGLSPDGPGETSTPDKPKELEEVVVTASKRNSWGYTKWAMFAEMNKKQDQVALNNYLSKQGVDDRGLRLFNQAWDAIGYRERLAEIERSWREFIESALLEGATWVGGGVVMKAGGKLIKVGYRAYKLNRARKAASLINQTSTAILKNGYYEVNGLKFTEYYYNKLWNTGRKAPSLVAREVLAGAETVVPNYGLIRPGFDKIFTGRWEMIYNQTTKEVWHLQPIR